MQRAVAQPEALVQAPVVALQVAQVLEPGRALELVPQAEQQLVVLLQVPAQLPGRLVQQQPEQRLPEDLALQRVLQQQLQLQQSRPAVARPQTHLAPVLATKEYLSLGQSNVPDTAKAPHRRGFFLSLVLTGSLLMSGCTSTGLSTAQILRDAIRGGSVSIPADLESAPYKYLWARAAGSESLLVLGAVEDTVDGPVQVWFTGQQQIIRIQNGRIVSTQGLTTDWVRSRVLSTTSGALVRERDVMPGWRYGIREQIESQTQATAPSKASSLFRPKLLASKKITTWRLERSPQAPELGQSIYALNADGQTIAGFECLSAELCISWERLN